MAEPWVNMSTADVVQFTPAENKPRACVAMADAYMAAGGKLSDHPVQFIWLVTNEKHRQVIIPVADIHRMEPPADAINEIAYIHLSRMTVALYGSNLHRVLFQIQMGQCSSVHEIKPGQTIPSAWEAVVSRIEYIHAT